MKLNPPALNGTDRRINTDKTTSDLLPSGSAPDIAGALHLADLIRSSSVAPLKATAGFLRRLNHDNPNVQLLTLQVLDIAIKNGGTPFLLVIGGREPTNDLERLARAREGSSNRQVQELVLKLIQDWASAFSAKAGLRDTELVRAYESLRRDGMNFPPRDPLATAAMVDSLSVSLMFPLLQSRPSISTLSDPAAP
jgi:growth factor-regulated tyrosine kinase substrate